MARNDDGQKKSAVATTIQEPRKKGLRNRPAKQQGVSRAAQGSTARQFRSGRRACGRAYRQTTPVVWSSSHSSSEQRWAQESYPAACRQAAGRWSNGNSQQANGERQDGSGEDGRTEWSATDDDGWTTSLLGQRLSRL